MSEVALENTAQPARSRAYPLLPLLGWRNLWRNKRRTWLTAGGIAFAVLLVAFGSALQAGSYLQMQALATDMMTGHLQVANQQYIDDALFEATVAQASAKQQRLEALPGVRAVLPRLSAYALVSVGERSFGAQVLGLEVAAEALVFNYLGNLSAGRLPQPAASGSGFDNKQDETAEVAIGHILARNLRAQVGDELVVLGSGKEGGVAALVFRIVGLLNSGMSELDRSLVVAPLREVQWGFGFDDEVHTIVVRGDSADDGPELARSAGAALHDSPALQVRAWPELLPDIQQAIDIDRVSADIMYYIILGLVAFSVVNSFVMTIFERSREFGMLRALGMTPGQLVWLLQWESLFVWLLGTLLGTGLGILLVGWLANTGLDLGAAAESYSAELFMPTELYPALTPAAFSVAPIVLFVGCQLASFIPALRLYRLQPVAALRDE